MASEAVSLRSFLISEVLREFPDASVWQAVEGVASTAIDHPEWPSLDERRTWDEWRAYFSEGAHH